VEKNGKLGPRATPKCEAMCCIDGSIMCQAARGRLWTCATHTHTYTHTQQTGPGNWQHFGNNPHTHTHTQKRTHSHAHPLIGTDKYLCRPESRQSRQYTTLYVSLCVGACVYVCVCVGLNGCLGVRIRNRLQLLECANNLKRMCSNVHTQKLLPFTHAAQ